MWAVRAIVFPMQRQAHGRVMVLGTAPPAASAVTRLSYKLAMQRLARSLRAELGEFAIPVSLASPLGADEPSPRRADASSGSGSSGSSGGSGGGYGGSGYGGSGGSCAGCWAGASSRAPHPLEYPGHVVSSMLEGVPSIFPSMQVLTTAPSPLPTGEQHARGGALHLPPRWKSTYNALRVGRRTGRPSRLQSALADAAAAARLLAAHRLALRGGPTDRVAAQHASAHHGASSTPHRWAYRPRGARPALAPACASRLSEHKRKLLDRVSLPCKSSRRSAVPGRCVRLKVILTSGQYLRRTLTLAVDGGSS